MSRDSLPRLVIFIFIRMTPKLTENYLLLCQWLVKLVLLNLASYLTRTSSVIKWSQSQFNWVVGRIMRYDPCKGQNKIWHIMTPFWWLFLALPFGIHLLADILLSPAFPFYHLFALTSRKSRARGCAGALCKDLLSSLQL